MKGSYILLINLPEGQTITIGRRQARYFPGGDYVYVGSAMAGFKSRLSRHFKADKKPHWHIDYLLQKASINSLILCETTERVECTIAQALSQRFDAIPGFGSSDCKCPSHLFFDNREMKSAIMSILNPLNVKPRWLAATLLSRLG